MVALQQYAYCLGPQPACLVAIVLSTISAMLAASLPAFVVMHCWPQCCKLRLHSLMLSWSRIKVGTLMDSCSQDSSAMRGWR